MFRSLALCRAAWLVPHLDMSTMLTYYMAMLILFT